jgi:hypothetical protein
VYVFVKSKEIFKIFRQGIIIKFKNKLSNKLSNLDPYFSQFFNFRYNISFIDPPLGGFGVIGAKPLGKYHHFGKYYAEPPRSGSINDKYSILTNKSKTNN